MTICGVSKVRLRLLAAGGWGEGQRPNLALLKAQLHFLPSTAFTWRLERLLPFLLYGNRKSL